NPALYEIYLYVAAIALIRRERKFIVTMSVSRHEFLAGSYLFLVALSAAMVVAIWLTSLIGYAALWALGYGMGAAITPMQLLTGNWAKLIVAFSWMASGAGIVTLIGYLTARWWKIILSVLGALIAAAILVATQLNLRTNAAMVLDWLERVVYWIFEVAVPMIYRYFWGAAPAAMVARNLLLGLGATVASYPVMRGMRIVK
ncbi:MAG: hypothetical protein GX558_07735, partial [Clostridiales bacterium]|nr:hypothetical protein [Clostridiales bacterium]